MKKYLRLTCTVCKRNIDKLVDLTHYTTDKCTITLGCEGRLQPLEYVSNGNIAVAPDAGVTDWRPRGTTVTATTVLQEQTFVNLSTGSKKQIVIAAPVNQPSLAVVFDLKTDTPKDYRQYVYRRDTTFATISGVESGLDKKALRFTGYGSAPDLVEVYLNGVQLDKGTGPADFQIYDGTANSPVPPNTILFNTPVQQAGIAQVDVIVSKEQAISTVQLTFTRNIEDESRAGTGAYENVNTVVVRGSTTYYLYHLDLDSSNIVLNSILFPSDSTLDYFFLLARAPYTQLDRYSDLIVPFSGLDEELEYLKFYAVNGSNTLQIVKTAVSGTYPPMRWNKFVYEKTIKTAVDGVTDQITIDGSVITGPDA